MTQLLAFFGLYALPKGKQRHNPICLSFFRFFFLLSLIEQMEIHEVNPEGLRDPGRGHKGQTVIGRTQQNDRK